MSVIQITQDMTEQESRTVQNSNNNFILGNASPKGVYPTLAALQAAHPTGTSGIYIVTADGNWYYWKVNAWTAGGIYQSTGVGTDVINEIGSQIDALKIVPLTGNINPNDCFAANTYVITGTIIGTGIGTSGVWKLEVSRNNSPTPNIITQKFDSGSGVLKRVVAEDFSSDTGFVLQDEVNTKQNKTITDTANNFKIKEVEPALAELGAKGSVVSDTTVNAAWLTGTWTADASTDTLTCSVAHGLTATDKLSFGVGTGVLPAGIVAEPEFYYVIAVTTYTVTISLTRIGTVVDITDNGVGGWTIRKANVPAFGVPLDFSSYSELDVYGIFSFVPNSGSGNCFPLMQFVPATTAKIFLNTGNYDNTSFIGLSGSAYTLKYVRLTCKISFRKLEQSLYHITVNMTGLGSNNFNMSSPTPYTSVYSGVITGADITLMVIFDSYTSTIKNGSRFIVVRR